MTNQIDETDEMPPTSLQNMSDYDIMLFIDNGYLEFATKSKVERSDVYTKWYDDTLNAGTLQFQDIWKFLEKHYEKPETWFHKNVIERIFHFAEVELYREFGITSCLPEEFQRGLATAIALYFYYVANELKVTTVPEIFSPIPPDEFFEDAKCLMESRNK